MRAEVRALDASSGARRCVIFNDPDLGICRNDITL